MNIYGPFIMQYLKSRTKAIDQFCSNPIKTQEQLLSNLLNKACNTEWGKRFEFSSIYNVSMFANRIPVQDYNSLKSDIERLLSGEQQILWPTIIKWFAKSSGTTSDRSKFIPVSKEALEDGHFKGAKDLMCLYVRNNPNTKVFNGKSLILGGSQNVYELNKSARYGDVSAVMIKNQPFLANLLRTPDLSVALMDDWEQKIARIADETKKQNITNLAGVPTWTLVLLKYLLDQEGVDSIKELWLNLELYMHGGVSFEPYKSEFHSLLGDNINYYQIYNASEGFFAFQDRNDQDDMLLAIDHGIYYEFIPQENYNDDDPITLTLSEVKVGKNYAVVITTNAGLWRYKIGDTIKFTNLNPFRVVVSGRTKHFINAFGEEVIIENADQAIKVACQKTGSKIREYTVAPVYFEGHAKARHQWLIEFVVPPQNGNDFTLELDTALRKVNSDYDAKRQNNMALTIPQLTVAREGLFYEWLKRKEKLGGQHKIPRLSNDRKYMDELLAMNQST